MASQSGTFTAVGQATTRHYLRPGEVVRATLTITGAMTIALNESIGPGQAFLALAAPYTASGTYEYRNTTKEPKYVQLLVTVASGSATYVFADITGDQILEEWFRADGTRVAYMSDEGYVGPMFTPQEQGGAVNVFDYMTPTEIADVLAGTAAVDVSAAINAAEAACAQFDLLTFPAGIYKASGLVGSRNFWRWRADGFVIIQNGANGDHLTHSGSDGHLLGFSFRADAQTPTYTGNGIVLTGARCKVELCEALFYSGRCLKMTGDRPVVKGLYAITSDTSGSGYECEFGLSGTARLYGTCEDLYTSQAVGGILTIDCGSFRVIGGQFGKYTVSAGTSPAGVNGGDLVGGARVLGAVTINISNAVVVGNHFGAIAFTWGAGTSGHHFEGNSEQSGFSMTNSGNLNSLILRANAGASGKIELRFGDDTSSSILKTVPNSDGLFEMKQLRFTNNFGARFRNAADNADAAAIIASASDNLSIQALVGSLQASAPSGQAHQFLVNAVEKLRVNVNGVYPGGTTSFISQGSGTPEGAVTAPVGSFFLRTDGGAVTSVYAKESGSGNTGWVAK